MITFSVVGHSSQYFLITPKLLTGLNYGPKMTILCVFNGANLPLSREWYQAQ